MLFSIIQQTENNWQCILVVDGEDDETKNLVASINDNRIEYHVRSKAFKPGLSGSRNFGLQKVKAPFLHFVDDDDILHSQFLELKLMAIKKMPEAFYVVSPLLNFSHNTPKAIQINNKAKAISIDWREYLKGQSGIFSCSVLWKAECYKELRFNEDLKVSEDYDLYWKLFKSFPYGVALNTPLYFRRVHENTNSGNLRKGKTDYNRDFMRSRKMALNTVLENDLMTKTLAFFFVLFGIKQKDNDFLQKVFLWNRSTKAFTVKDWFNIYAYRIKQYLKAGNGN